MSIYMITAGEVYFIREVLTEVASIADPSEYYEGEVAEAINLLNKLMSYNTEQILQIADNMNTQLQEFR